MKHFVITRFNLKLEQWKTAKDGSKVLTKDWLDQRFSLFERYCLPSVLNQSNSNFFWFLFFDTDTPNNYKKRIEELTKHYDHIHVFYIDGFKNLLKSLKEQISKLLQENDKYIITTRLDNDDAIHKDFIKAIQNLSIEKSETVIDLRNGFQINVLKKNYEVKEYFFPYNQFLSLIEDSNSFNTVLSKMHKDWSNSNSTKVEKNFPYWIEIIHDRNKSNDSKKYLSYSNKLNFSDFGIIMDYKARTSGEIFFLNILRVYPYKMIRIIYNRFKPILK